MIETPPADLVALLRCPACLHPVAAREDRVACVHPECGRRYPVVDGIPIMLVEKAEQPQGAARGDPRS